jgi:hypothetical protein
VGVKNLACNNRSFTYEEISNSEKLSTLLSFLWPERLERAHRFASVDRNEHDQLEFKLGRRFTERTAGGYRQIDSLTNCRTQPSHQGLKEYSTSESILLEIALGLEFVRFCGLKMAGV